MKDFFKYFTATLLALFVFIILFSLIAGNLFTGRREVEVADRAVLVFNLARPVSDKPVSRDFGNLLEAGTDETLLSPVPLRAVLESLEQAAGDRRITALYLRGQVPADANYSGWATLNEIRSAISRFKESGKPVIAYQENMNERTYYVASTADNVYLYPLGLFEINGLATTLLYFDSLLQRYGIEVQTVRAGRYKSAVEPFTRNSISEENREQLNALLQNVYDVYLTAVAQSQGLEPAVLSRLVETEGVLFPENAVSTRLVDALRPEYEVIDELRSLTGEPEPGSVEEYFRRSVSLPDYYRSLNRERRTLRDKIAIIYAEGAIVNGYSRNEVAAEYIIRLLRTARLDNDVKAVVLRINSPGGSATASDKIYREALLLRAVKPLVVSMGSTAASGGYMLAMAGQRLFASANTLTGSIGVFSLIPDLSGLLEQLEVNTSVVETAPLADEPSVFRPLSERERAQLQRYIELLYNTFISYVATGRNLPVATVQEIAQGRIYSGQRALELGLVGELGGLREAILAAAELAQITGYSIIEYQQPLGWEELLTGLLQQGRALTQEQGPANQDLLEKGLRWLRRQAEELKNYDDPHGIYARLPYDLIID